MLTTNMRLQVIGAIQRHRLSLPQLVFILQIYYKRESFEGWELDIITNMYNKVIDGEINAANYMDFFNGLHPVRRTDRFDYTSGVQDLLAHQDEIKNIK